MRKQLLGALAAMLMLATVAGSALADGLNGDADALSTGVGGHGNNRNANQQAGTTVEYDLSAHVSSGGSASNAVFKNPGDEVTVPITRSGDWLAAPAGSPASFIFTHYEVSQAGKIRITVPCSAANGVVEVMTAALAATVETGQINPNSVNLTYTITATTPAAFSCAPIDTTPPVVACGADLTAEATSPLGAVVNWSTTKCTASDAGDPAVSDCTETPGSGSLFPIQSTAVTCSVTDASGNTGSDVFNVIVGDSTAPEVNCSAPSTTPWYNANVEVDCTASDAASPPAVPAAFTLTTSGEGAAQNTNTQQVCDSDTPANCVTAGPYGAYKVDMTDPDVVCTPPDDSIWYGTNVTVPCTGSDPLSGLADAGDAAFNLTTNVAAGAETNSASTDSRDVYDEAGNLTTAGTYTFKVDLKGPTVACGSMPTFTLNQAGATVGATVTDGGSGPLSSPVTAAADTSSVGANKSVNVTGYDNVGNSTTQACSYNVVFSVCALYDQAKSHKAGSTVPIKIQLCDANGVNVSGADVVVQAFTLKRVDTSASGILEDSGSANQPEYNFRYDASLAGYIFNLSTKSPSPALGAGSTKLSIGTWKLTFKVDGIESASYSVQFDVK